jgi:hypothetical protein
VVVVVAEALVVVVGVTATKEAVDTLHVVLVLEAVGRKSQSRIVSGHLWWTGLRARSSSPSSPNTFVTIAGTNTLLTCVGGFISIGKQSSARTIRRTGSAR